MESLHVEVVNATATSLEELLASIGQDQSKILAAVIAPFILASVSIALDTVHAAKTGLPLDPPLAQLQKELKTLYDVVKVS